jgi:hypothetical protein
MFRVEWDEQPRRSNRSVEKNEFFDTEEDARKFARSLRDDVWSSKSCVSVYYEGRRIAASFDDHNPL